MIDPPAPYSPSPMPRAPEPPKQLDAYANGGTAQKKLASPLEPKLPNGVSYGPSRGPMFARVAPTIADVRQGDKLGDCWFIAAVASLAHARPTALRDMVREAGPEQYDVRFFHEGREEWVRVTTELPREADGSMPFAPMTDGDHDGLKERWLPLIEKAYARFAEQHYGRAGYDALDGGHAARAIQALTGNHVRIYTSLEAQRVPADGRVAVVQTRSDSARLIGSHAYSLFQERGELLLRNPWGDDPRSSSRDGRVSANSVSIRRDVALVIIEDPQPSLRLSF